MVKWLEIARKPSEMRFKVLSDFLKNSGIDNSVDFLEVEPFDFEDKLMSKLNDYDAIRIGSPYGSQVVQLFQGQDAEVLRIQAADSMWKKNGHWNLMSANYLGLKRIVNENGNIIDLDSSVLIVGAGAGARVAIAALARLGIKNFKIANKFAEQAEELIESLKKSYFGIEFQFIPEDQLVLLPGTNSVLVNTTPLVASNDLLKELYYFNFLKTPGLVIDFTIIPINTPLVTEAEQIAIHSVRGYEVSSWGDMEWIESWLGKTLNREEYCEKLRQAVAQLEFEHMSNFQKRGSKRSETE